MGKPEVARDWRLIVEMILSNCIGKLGTAVMAMRLLRQQHSQSNSFITIAGSEQVRRLNGQAMTPTQCESYFNLSLARFIAELDGGQIPDEPFAQLQHVRCSERENGRRCALVA